LKIIIFLNFKYLLKTSLITVFQVFDSHSLFKLSDSTLSQKNIQKNKLGQSTSKQQLKIFKFEENIPAFSACLSVLITVCHVFDSNYFLIVRQHIVSKNNVKNKPGEKLRRLYLQCSQNWSEIYCFFVQHQAVIIFKNSKHKISSTLNIFLLNFCRKAIPNVFLAGLLPFSRFFDKK
jgi:hypothetical protein